MRLNPRLSMSSTLAPAWSFEQHLAYWDKIGCRSVGFHIRKADEHGFDAAIDALRQRGLRISCIITGALDLYNPETWQASRDIISRGLHATRELGGCVYGVTGRGRYDQWDDNLRAYGEVVAPCVEEARAIGTTFGIEPTLRPQISFVHTNVDALDVAAATGVKVVVDVGNCWQERGAIETIRRMGDRIAVVQLSDFRVGTMENPGPRDKILPGEGELPLHLFVQAAVDAGYTGDFDVELQGPKEADEEAMTRSALFASKVLDDVLGG